MKVIIENDRKLGKLHFKLDWNGGDTTWESLKEMREEYPRITAQCILGNKSSWSKSGGDRVLQRAKKVVRDLDLTVHRINRIYDLYLDDHDELRIIHRVQKGSRKGSNKGRRNVSNAPVFKYGIEVPKKPEHAMKMGEKNGKEFWQDVINKKIKALLEMDCLISYRWIL